MRLDISEYVHTKRQKRGLLITDLIRTESYRIGFLFARSICERGDFEENVLDITSFSDFDINIFQLWGTNTGITSPFITTEGSGRDAGHRLNLPYETRKMSPTEFYTCVGYKQTTRQITEFKDAETGQHSEVIVTELELQLLSNKTSLEAYRNYLHTYFERLPRLI